MDDEQSPVQLFAELTERQREVAFLLAEGLSRAEIAARLCISVHTAHEHERHVYETLDCHCRSQVAVFVLRLNLDEQSPK